jgi:hypothetical protein
VRAALEGFSIIDPAAADLNSADWKLMRCAKDFVLASATWPGVGRGRRACARVSSFAARRRRPPPAHDAHDHADAAQAKEDARNGPEGGGARARLAVGRLWSACRQTTHSTFWKTISVT